MIHFYFTHLTSLSSTAGIKLEKTLNLGLPRDRSSIDTSGT